MKILMINGPNLNRLGKRNADHYGSLTLDALTDQVEAYGDSIGMKITSVQSNWEGQIIDWVHEAEATFHGIIINPGALTHYSYALRDAIESICIPCVEVHLSNIYQREDFRRNSVTAPVCRGQFYGMKELSYFEGLRHLKTLLSSHTSDRIDM